MQGKLQMINIFLSSITIIFVGGGGSGRSGTFSVGGIKILRIFLGSDLHNTHISEALGLLNSIYISKYPSRSTKLEYPYKVVFPK